MEDPQWIRIGYQGALNILRSRNYRERLSYYMLNSTDFDGRVAYTLYEYLLKHPKEVSKVTFHYTYLGNRLLPNGTLQGVAGLVNQSAVDIAVQPTIINEISVQYVDFAYPFKLSSYTFSTAKPEYEPFMFGILQTFPLPLWMAILSAFLVMSLVYYATLRWKYSLDKILLHVLAVLVRQSSIFRPSFLSVNLLVYSWVVGAMFLCLAYDSVFLSFLAIPPVAPIKDVVQLAQAVQNGEYHCIAASFSGIENLLARSNDTNLKILGNDIKENNLNIPDIKVDFMLGKNRKKKLALVSSVVYTGYLTGQHFISEDRFMESMPAIYFRKNFCCKKMIDNFVHRLMASGLFYKYRSDVSFYFWLSHSVDQPEEDADLRPLVLTDVAPAFIVLVVGYVTSFMALVGEILVSRRKNMNCKRNSKK